MLSRALRAANARIGCGKDKAIGVFRARAMLGVPCLAVAKARHPSNSVPILDQISENYSAHLRKIAIDKVYKFYRLTGETEVDMSYIQNAQTDRSSQRLVNAQAFRPAYAGAFAYIVFALAFVFTGAVVLGLIP
ncbi:hypothetical protein [Mesorhizobium sangaii]|uniref:Uncharacterized protein n=2 Tax=Mesorhizobium TaxID=68287 RepID=A0A841P7P3_9HYPH|nr:hypothetical protein [Mesorhizobium sangaii]MBB6409453.1 hypothetical protein [Mesorhizobium sangaii]